MNRRNFIRAIASAAVGAAIAPVLPVTDRTAELNGFVESLNDGLCETILKAIPSRQLADTFFRSTPMWYYFSREGIWYSDKNGGWTKLASKS